MMVPDGAAGARSPAVAAARAELGSLRGLERLRGKPLARATAQTWRARASLDDLEGFEEGCRGGRCWLLLAVRVEAEALRLDLRVP